MRILGGGVAVLLLLSACGPGTGGVIVPPGYDDLDPCAVREIAAADLAGIGAPGCDLAGSTVVLPDGYRFALQEVGVAAVESPDVAAGATTVRPGRPLPALRADRSSGPPPC